MTFKMKKITNSYNLSEYFDDCGTYSFSTDLGKRNMYKSTGTLRCKFVDYHN